MRPKYIVRVEERVYVTDEADETVKPQLRIPDIEVVSRPGWEETPFSPRGEASQLEVAEPVVAITWFEEEIHEAFLKVIDVKTRDVVDVIEILSPANKVPGSPGRESFEKKRREVMRSPSHWVEIDLLRGKSDGTRPQEGRIALVSGPRFEGRPEASGAALSNPFASASPGHPNPLEARRSRRSARHAGGARCGLRPRGL